MGHIFSTPLFWVRWDRWDRWVYMAIPPYTPLYPHIGLYFFYFLGLSTPINGYIAIPYNLGYTGGVPGGPGRPPRIFPRAREISRARRGGSRGGPGAVFRVFRQSAKTRKLGPKWPRNGPPDMTRYTGGFRSSDNPIRWYTDDRIHRCNRWHGVQPYRCGINVIAINHRLPSSISIHCDEYQAHCHSRLPRSMSSHRHNDAMTVIMLSDHCDDIHRYRYRYHRYRCMSMTLQWYAMYRFD